MGRDFVCAFLRTHAHARTCVCVAGELVAGDQGAIFTEAGKPRARTHGPTKCSVKTRSHSALEGKGFYSSRFRSGSESSKRGASFFAQVTFSERRNFKPHDEKIKVIFDTLTQLDHPNIVKLHKYWIDTKDEKKRVSPFCRCLGDFFFLLMCLSCCTKKIFKFRTFFFNLPTVVITTKPHINAAVMLLLSKTFGEQFFTLASLISFTRLLRSYGRWALYLEQHHKATL